MFLKSFLHRAMSPLWHNRNSWYSYIITAQDILAPECFSVALMQGHERTVKYVSREKLAVDGGGACCPRIAVYATP